MKRFLTTVAALTLGTVAFQAGPAFAATRVVDDDKQQCPNAQYTTINEANAAAAPGDTIQVCPGLYEEAVNVVKPDLTFRGAGASRTPTRTSCLGFGTPNPQRDSIVDGVGFAFNLLNQGISIIGFVIENSELYGIYTSGVFSDHYIRNNIIQDNAFGLYFNSNGVEESTAEHNCYRSNNLGLGVAAAAGNGVYSDQGLRNAEIEDSTFTGHLNAAIIITGVTGTVQSQIQIENNDLVDESSIALFFVGDSEITHNRIVRTRHGSAIFLGGGTTNNLIEDNQLRHGGEFSGIVLGDPFGLGGAANTLNRIRRNHVDGYAIDGIVLRAGAVDNDVLLNISDDNGRDGIAARVGATGNRFLDNNMHGNSEHDAHDDNRPANTWEGNSCDTDFPPGTICGDGGGGGGEV